jgi:hypothetical protein
MTTASTARLCTSSRGSRIADRLPLLQRHHVRHPRRVVPERVAEQHSGQAEEDREQQDHDRAQMYQELGTDQELSALRTAWLASYAVTGRPEAPLEWHVRFATARQRLTDWVARTGCRPGEHRVT